MSIRHYHVHTSRCEEQAMLMAYLSLYIYHTSLNKQKPEKLYILNMLGSWESTHPLCKDNTTQRDNLVDITCVTAKLLYDHKSGKRCSIVNCSSKVKYPIISQKSSFFTISNISNIIKVIRQWNLWNLGLRTCEALMKWW